MRVAHIVFFLMLCSGPALAETISPTDAASHRGQRVTVEGIVSEVFTSRRGDTFIDISGRYPNENFYGVIFSDSSAAIGNIDGLTGKTVDVTGMIKLYRGKPEIIVRTRNQIKVR